MGRGADDGGPYKVSGCVFSSRFRTSTGHHRSVLATFELLLSLLVSCVRFLLCLARVLRSSVVSAVLIYLLLLIKSLY